MFTYTPESNLVPLAADVSSLYTIKQLLQTNITGIMVVECFSWNLICEELDIRLYPIVYFAR